MGAIRTSGRWAAWERSGDITGRAGPSTDDPDADDSVALGAAAAGVTGAVRPAARTTAAAAAPTSARAPLRAPAMASSRRGH
ncbi:uncharacterized protein PD653_4559 [Nocardioides sp. PD653]|nr:uncharacterized protein PD653_4559 [Nocardioides sp. PD653]